ncbi:hypothetical protein GE278_22845 (plasmid) [Enterobacteriaceae bacterium Kacie_13]|nr:hypothetical protein GE278_22845 [Enterobacteriaceae bacterium Kacie_13]
MTDAIDKAAGLSPEDALYATRRFRPEFVDGAELCRLSVLQPANDQGLAADLRLALAQRIAALNADHSLVQDYAAQLAQSQPTPPVLALAAGETHLAEPLATIARHVDVITLTPASADVGDIRRLESAGLTSPQIVALSELIAFVNFQTKVAAGLRLMELS